MSDPGGVVHVVKTQHWTWCRLRVVRMDRVLDVAALRVLLHEHRPDPGTPPPGVCGGCWRRWRADPDRRQ